MNTPFGNSITTAEHAIAMMLALARQIPEANASTQAGKWEKNRFMGVEITGKTLGVIGCGNIGSIVADRGARPEDEGHRLRSVPVAERAIRRSASRRSNSTNCSRADFITLHTPLTDKTRNIIDADAIAKMKNGVRIINCARGGLVDEAGAAEAAEERQGRRRGASTCSRRAGDQSPAVRPGERRLHAASRRLDHEAQENVALQVAEQMSDYLIKGAVSNALNMPSITAEEAPRLKPFVKLAEKLGSFAGQLTETRSPASSSSMRARAAR
jgi:D-3-phosphoglycerate dehydrogenase